jgi:hypothetical protein
MTDIIKSAVISKCHQYRYRLTRYWGPGYMLPFVMLNPSTADASIDDPTIRRCMGFARREGAGGIIVSNLYGFRATSPADMQDAIEPTGPLNESYLHQLAIEAAATRMPIVCAWGTHGRDGASWARSIFEREGARLVCLGKTKDGHPRHPLYVKGDQPLVSFQ